MKKLIYLLCSVLLLFMVLTSCEKDEQADRTVEITATVWHQYVKYTNMGGKITNGIQIRENDSGEWIQLHGITGFDYEEGYEYKIRLLKTYLANPPMDAGSTEYKLIEVISKTSKD